MPQQNDEVPKVVESTTELTTKQKIEAALNKPADTIPPLVTTPTVTTPPKPEVSKEPTIMELVARANAHIITLKTSVMRFHGKHNMNPTLWLKNKGITKAEAVLKDGVMDELTRKVALDVLAVRDEEPKIPVIRTMGLREMMENASEKKDKR